MALLPRKKPGKKSKPPAPPDTRMFEDSDKLAKMVQLLGKNIIEASKNDCDTVYWDLSDAEYPMIIKIQDLLREEGFSITYANHAMRIKAPTKN